MFFENYYSAQYCSFFTKNICRTWYVTMRGLLSILIFTMLLKSMYGQLLYDDFGEQQKCVNVPTHIINDELRQLTKNMESMVKQNMEGIKNLDANVRNLKSDLQKLVVLQKEATDNSTNIIGDKSTCSSGRTPISGLYYS